MRISPCCGSVNAVGGERSITYLLYAAISIRSRDFPVAKRLSSAWWSLQREDAGQRRLAHLDRLPPQVRAVQLQQIEGIENACGSFCLRRITRKTAKPFSSQQTASPSIRQDRTLRWFTASTISGKRVVQSLPLCA
jgi:hypothetical protein